MPPPAHITIGGGRGRIGEGRHTTGGGVSAGASASGASSFQSPRSPPPRSPPRRSPPPDSTPPRSPPPRSPPSRSPSPESPDSTPLRSLQPPSPPPYMALIECNRTAVLMIGGNRPRVSLNDDHIKELHAILTKQKRNLVKLCRKKKRILTSLGKVVQNEQLAERLIRKYNTAIKKEYQHQSAMAFGGTVQGEVADRKGKGKVVIEISSESSD